MILLLLPVLSIVLTIVMVVAAFRTRKKMIRAIDELLGSITDRFINAVNDPMRDPPPQQAAGNQGRRMAGAAAGGALGGILMADRAMQMVNRYSSDTSADAHGDQVDVDASQTNAQQTDVEQGDVEHKSGDTRSGDTAVTNDQAAQDEAERVKASGGITGSGKQSGSSVETGAAESVSTDVTTSNEAGVADAGSDSVVEKRAEEDAGKIRREHAAKAVVHAGEAVAGAYAGDADMAARGAAQTIDEAKQAGDKEGAKAQAKQEIRSGEEVEHGVVKGAADATKDVAADTVGGSMPGAPVPAGAEGTAGAQDGVTGKKVVHGTMKQGSDIPSKPGQSAAPKPVPTVDDTNPSAVKTPSAPKSAPGANRVSTSNMSVPEPSTADQPPTRPPCADTEKTSYTK